jgi:GAF domain-containing protein
MSETATYEALVAAARKIVAGDGDRDAKLKRICVLLAEKVPYYNWVGFYLVPPDEQDELVLGPYVGEPTEHTRISFGTGICGQAAARGEAFVVQDVSKESNYLACSASVRAEIVVPILKGGQVVGELDIDSHTPAPFTDRDREALDAICLAVTALF